MGAAAAAAAAWPPTPAQVCSMFRVLCAGLFVCVCEVSGSSCCSSGSMAAPACAIVIYVIASYLLYQISAHTAGLGAAASA